MGRQRGNTTEIALSTQEINRNVLNIANVLFSHVLNISNVFYSQTFSDVSLNCDGIVIKDAPFFDVRFRTTYQTAMFHKLVART